MSNRSTSITVYCGVPLNNKYEHTFRDHDYIARSAKSSYTFSSLSYTRVSSNKIRVDYVRGDGFNIFKATYMIINNVSREGIDYYCFVNEVKYINDVTVEITFEVDVIQTWLIPNLSNVKTCFIDRQHQSNDTIGANIIPENVSLGETKEIYRASTNHDFILVFDCNVGADGTVMYGVVIEGIVYQLSRTEFALSSDGQLDAKQWLIDNGEKLKDSLVGCRLAPSLVSVLRSGSYNQDVLTVTRPDTLDGYTPKNNKLLTAPYLSLVIKTPYGQQKSYAYEFFSNQSSAKFREGMGVEPTSTMTLAPHNYYGNSAIHNVGEGITLGALPIMPSTSSAYKNWMAQKYAGVGGDITSLFGSATAGFVVGSMAHNPVTGLIGAGVGVLASLAGKIGGAITEGNQAKLKGTDVISRGSGGVRDYQIGLYNFFAFDRTINAQTAKVIDDYFTMFGYKQNKLAEPHFSNKRFNWHFIKTIGFNFQCNCPSADLAKICTIMDNGITFWDTTKIGDYS